MLKCLFIGSKVLGLEALKTLCNISRENIVACVTIDDTNDVRCILEEFKAYTTCKQLPMHILQKPSQLKKVIQEYNPDFCFVVGWYWVLPADVLNLVPNGFFGLHASLLPKYRGGSPLVWQLINGEKSGGVTLFKFDTGMDTGDIFGQESFVIDDDDTIYQMLLKTELCIVNLIQQSFPAFISGLFIGRKQDNSLAVYCSVRKPEDGKIKWEWNADRVYNFIRAQTNPYPGAFCFRENGQKLIIWSVKRFEFDFFGPPGRVSQVQDGGVIVSCGNGAVVVYTVQIPDGECISAKELLKFGETLK